LAEHRQSRAIDAPRPKALATKIKVLGGYELNGVYALIYEAGDGAGWTVRVAQKALSTTATGAIDQQNHRYPAGLIEIAGTMVTAALRN